MGSDPFFAMAKISWFFLHPASLLLALFLIGWILLWGRFFRLGRWLLSLALVTLLLVLFLNIDQMILYPLEHRFPKYASYSQQGTKGNDIKGIIVLGGAIKEDLSAHHGAVQTNSAAERLTETLLLAKKYPDLEIVFSGYSGSWGYSGSSEADAARAFFSAFGLAERVRYENQAVNTWENAVYSYRLVDPLPSENWLLLTSAYHVPRSVGTFRKVGWKVTPVPVDYNTGEDVGLRLGLPDFDKLQVLALALHEWVGLGFYYLAGKSSALFPEPFPDRH